MSNIHHKVDWKKRVRQEYFRLRQIKKFQRSDNIKTAFTSNLSCISEKLDQLQEHCSKLKAQKISSGGSFAHEPVTK